MNRLNSFWLWLTAWPRGLVSWIHAAFCALLTPEGRRGWAVIIAWGCGVVETAIGAAVLYLVRRNPMLAFWIGLSSQFIVLVVITAFTGLLVKREIGGSVSKDGGSFTINDTGDSSGGGQ
jgi:hypothetical protein